MKLIFRLAAISIALVCSLGPGKAQNTPTPKAEDAEKNAFQMPTTGKHSPPDHSERPKSDPNPESRFNDEPPANEKVGTSNVPGK